MIRRGRFAVVSALAGFLAAAALAFSPIDHAHPDGQLPVIAWQQPTVTLTEGGSVQTVQIIAWRTIEGARVTEGELTVPYTVAGTATYGADYRLEPLEAVTFGDGRTNASLRITVVDDDEPESRETVEISLQDGDGYLVDPQLRTLVVSIVDNDEAAAPEPSSDRGQEPVEPEPLRAPTPAVASLSPAAAPADRAFSLTVRGEGFLRTSVIRWGDQAVPTRYVSSTELRAQISRRLLELESGDAVSVTVVNPPPGGGASEPASVQILRRDQERGRPRP